MRRGQAGGEAGRTGADDDDVPVAEVIEIERRLEGLDVEVGHGATLLEL